MKIVTIIIPVFNASKYIEKCISSLLNQSYSHIEIICVDNNSKDNSLSILNNFAKLDNRIKVYVNKMSGASATRNYGIKKALGEYIVFVDADDWVGPDYVKNLYESIEKNDVDMSCSIINQQNASGNVWITDWYKYVDLNIYYNKTYNKDFFLLNIESFPFESFSKIFKTAVLKKSNILYKTHLIIGEDIDFILQYVMAIDNFTFNFLYKADYFYLYSNSTISYNPKKFVSIFNLLNEIEKIYPKAEKYKKILVNFRVKKLFYYAMPIWEVVAPYSYFKQLKNYMPKKEDYKYLRSDTISIFQRVNSYSINPLASYLKLSLYLRFNFKEDFYIIRYLPKSLILGVTKFILNIYAKIMRV